VVPFTPPHRPALTLNAAEIEFQKAEITWGATTPDRNGHAGRGEGGTTAGENVGHR